MIVYKETITLVKPMVNGYGTERVDEQQVVPGLFMQGTGWSHGANQTAVTSDATAYVDPSNQFVIDNFDRLEGMMVVASLFGVDQTDAWYRVTNIVVGRDALLCNQIDNIELQLKKTTELPA